MSTLQWIGGGSNSATDPNDWSPAGAPRPGDVLNIADSVLNLAGGNLAGDTLHVRDMSGHPGGIADPVINVSRGAHLSVTLDAPSASTSEPVINVSGSATVDAQLIGSRANAVVLTENIARNSVLHGVIAVNRGNVAINGLGPHARFDNDGTSDFSNDSAIIRAGVVGHGTFFVDEGGLELTRSVGAGQAFILPTGFLTVDDPAEFKGTLAVRPGTDFNDTGRALFEGVHATSYDFANSRLTLYDGHKSVLSVHVAAPYAEAQASGTGVTIFIGSHPLASLEPVLPGHTNGLTT
jgi:hypothetical protein